MTGEEQKKQARGRTNGGPPRTLPCKFRGQSARRKEKRRRFSEGSPRSLVFKLRGRRARSCEKKPRDRRARRYANFEGYLVERLADTSRGGRRIKFTGYLAKRMEDTPFEGRRTKFKDCLVERLTDNPVLRGRRTEKLARRRKQVQMTVVTCSVA